jgi:hypothetical protein
MILVQTSGQLGLIVQVHAAQAIFSLILGRVDLPRSWLRPLEPLVSVCHTMAGNVIAPGDRQMALRGCAAGMVEQASSPPRQPPSLDIDP